MTPQLSPPSYGTSGSPSGSAPTNGSPQRMALDNIIRRELRVSDPNDPMQIAQALLTRYQDTPRAQAISQEAKGLPFLQAAPMQALVPQAATSSDSELQQAKDDVDRDLHELTTNSLLKDVTPELQGWAQAVRSAITEGTTAARFALDPRQRDKAFGIRRQLGDYARVARLVGALTPTLSLTYRKFAQSLDEVAAVILVTMGEALANAGLSGGRFLLQVPYTELQVRRDVAIAALRNLIGSAQETYGQNEYHRGLHAYRLLFKKLEDLGQGELRTLLVESQLAQIMDEMIHRAAHGRPEGLRALGATAQLDVHRFRRLVVIGQSVLGTQASTRTRARITSPPISDSPPLVSDSPPLVSFLDALLLFVEAFDNAGGFRLLRIARPPILLYGLYGTTGLDKAEKRLLDLVIQRNLLADELDCFLQCDCSEPKVTCQIILDKILYDVDRAIDLYALGNDDLGEPECRAGAYAAVIDAFLNSNPCNLGDSPPSSLIPGILDTIVARLQPVATDPFWDLSSAGEFAKQACIDLRKEELCLQHDMEGQWQNLVKTMAPNCVAGGLGSVFIAIENIIRAAIALVIGVVTDDVDLDEECPPIDVFVPETPDLSQLRIAQGIEAKFP